MSSNKINDRKILVDVFEPKRIVKILQGYNYPVEVVPLEASDYIIGNVMIERKTASDFFLSIMQGRLWNQLYKMSTTGKKGFLVVIGPIPLRIGRRKLSRAEYVRKLNLMNTVELISPLSYNIPMIKRTSEHEFINFIQKLWERSEKTPTVRPVIKKSISIPAIKSDILCCVPGFGRKTANVLVGKYKLIELITMSPKKLEKIKIGNRKLGHKAHNIRKVFSN